MSTGGSSASESVSSFSQESPSSQRIERSPQNQPVFPALPLHEQQIRGAGFYQDALSTGSSPYNSPYYTTPPRYSAQLPPTPSPQNHHPLSPAYTSPAVFDQASHYSQVSPQNSHQVYQQKLSQAQSPSTISQESPQNCFPQSSPQNETSNTFGTNNQQQSAPEYSQQSPLSQQSPQSQPSPQQLTIADYSQPSPNNFMQPMQPQSSTLKF